MGGWNQASVKMDVSLDSADPFSGGAATVLHIADDLKSTGSVDIDLDHIHQSRGLDRSAAVCLRPVHEQREEIAHSDDPVHVEIRRARSAHSCCTPLILGQT